MPAELTKPQRQLLADLIRYARVRVLRGKMPEAGELVAMGLARDVTPADARSMMLIATHAGREIAERRPTEDDPHA